MFTGVLLLNNSLLLVHTGNVLELDFPKTFNKRLTKWGMIAYCLIEYSKNMENDRNLSARPA